jgi:hypothetical protein
MHYTLFDVDDLLSDGDIGANGNVIDAYMKQKHRLLWHHRHPEKPLM